MGNTPNFGFYYPEDSTPNDLHTFLLTLASQVETEMSRQGTLENRPAAGVKGRLYWATTAHSPFDNSIITWNVLYRDDGSTWQQLTPSPWVPWTPTISEVDGGGNPVGNVTHSVSGSPRVSQYRILP